jgi:hypothetical protein
MRVVVDASDTMARLSQVAIWSFDPEAWGECAQAGTEQLARADFARRINRSADDLEVRERITGCEGTFSDDLLPAGDAQIVLTAQILDAQRSRTLALLNAASDEALDRRDPTVEQPAWMAWRTPREIIRHIADTESRAYLRWCGLPQLEPISDLREELDRSAVHIRDVIHSMPRTFRAEHHGEIWTPVKLLRRLGLSV